ncbi:MAG: hypothetical protein ACTHMM_06220 [Agriterribacter sp.]
MNNEDYYSKQRKRVYKNYQSEHSHFGDRNKLADWYVKQLIKQNCKCYYCETSIHHIAQLIEMKVLKTRKVRGGGKRGPVLEIAKQENGHTSENCVLSCYYCNNDKSYTTTQDDYKKHFEENRKKYFASLTETYI